jgi:hypothetical protein
MASRRSQAVFGRDGPATRAAAPRGRATARRALDGDRLQEIILTEAYRTIKVGDGNRQVTVPLAQAVMRTLAVNAARGQPRAQRLFAERPGKPADVHRL